MLKFLTKYFNKLFFLDAGDIIWAKRYQNEEEKAKIKIGHQEGPYIVFKKTFFNVYGLFCTSKYTNNNLYYELTKEKYNFSKNSYIRLNDLTKLTKFQFIKKISKLEESELNNLRKKVYCFWKYKYQQQNKIINKLKFYFTVGDIIIDKNNLYYIFKMDKEFYYTYRIHIKMNCKEPIIINDTYYSFDIGGLKKFKKSEKLTIFDSIETDKIEIINNQINAYKKRKLDKTIKRGCLVKYQDNYYYIFGEYQNNFLAYKIYLSNYKDNSMLKIEINRGLYFTKFEELKITKSENLKMVRLAKDEEIEKIKDLKLNLKNEIKKLKVKSKPVMLHQKIKPRRIIIDDEQKNYLVISRKGNLIKCVDLDNLDNIIEITLNTNCFYGMGEILSDYAYQNIMIKLKNTVKN